jgi:hypothetical protein
MMHALANATRPVKSARAREPAAWGLLLARFDMALTAIRRRRARARAAVRFVAPGALLWARHSVGRGEAPAGDGGA